MPLDQINVYTKSVLHLKALLKRSEDRKFMSNYRRFKQIGKLLTGWGTLQNISILSEEAAAAATATY